MKVAYEIPLKRVKKWLVLGISVLTLVSGMWITRGNTVLAANTTYYVSPSGKDNNNGTSTSTPWQTVSKVNSMSLGQGDKIYFQGGQWFEGQLKFNNSKSGMAGNPITVGSYGSGKATLTNTAGQQDNKFEFFGSWTNNTSDWSGYGNDNHWSATTNNYFTLKYYGNQLSYLVKKEIGEGAKLYLSIAVRIPMSIYMPAL